VPEGWNTAHVQQYEAALLQLIGNPGAWVSTFSSGAGGAAGVAAVREIRNSFSDLRIRYGICRGAAVGMRTDNPVLFWRRTVRRLHDLASSSMGFGAAARLQFEQRS
jgi:hypothetical protein